jgi:hypothetical protein
MPNTDDESKAAAAHQAKHRPAGDYDVGYCKPPVEHRFKHGNNANPKGRKKGAKNRKVVVEDVLFELVTVRDGGEIKQMPILEAVIKMTATKALAGDSKAAFAIIALAQREGLLTPEQQEVVENLSDNDTAIMEDFKRRFGNRALEPSRTPGPSVPADSSRAAVGQAAKLPPENTLPPVYRPLPGDPSDQPLGRPPKVTRPVP